MCCLLWKLDEKNKPKQNKTQWEPPEPQTQATDQIGMSAFLQPVLDLSETEHSSSLVNVWDESPFAYLLIIICSKASASGRLISQPFLKDGLRRSMAKELDREIDGVDMFFSESWWPGSVWGVLQIARFLFCFLPKNKSSCLVINIQLTSYLLFGRLPSVSYWINTQKTCFTYDCIQRLLRDLAEWWQRNHMMTCWLRIPAALAEKNGGTDSKPPYFDWLQWFL